MKKRRQPHSAKHRAGHRSAFTLVEMLTVLVIVGIIMATVLAPLSRMMLGSGVDAGASMLAAQLRLARQYAISNRERVAVLMPAAELSSYSGFAFTSFRSCVVTGSSSPYTFSRWIDNTKWEFLPVGTAIFEADGAKSVGIYTNAAPPEDDTSTKAIVNGVVSDFDFNGSNETISGVRAVVFRPTGALDHSMRYVTVGEGIRESAWIIRNGSNWKDLEINQYTGRVRFRED